MLSLTQVQNFIHILHEIQREVFGGFGALERGMKKGSMRNEEHQDPGFWDGGTLRGI